MTTVNAPNRGMVYIHSAPPALCPHVEWALAGVLGVPVNLSWTPQPAAPTTRRAEYSWSAPGGTGARLASSLNSWQQLRFEVTEDFSAASEGHRWSYTPGLGLFYAATGVHGDIMIGEERIKNAMLGETLGREPVTVALDRLLGRPRDDELEIFRHAGDDVPVRWLHRVG